jgi:hypothetical protein
MAWQAFRTVPRSGEDEPPGSRRGGRKVCPYVKKTWFRGMGDHSTRKTRDKTVDY